MTKKSKENLQRWGKKIISRVGLIGAIASIIALLWTWFFTPSPMVKITFGDNNSLPLLEASQNGNVEIEKLEISKILYQPPGKKNKPREIHINETVESEGIIWFELNLKELGGYLLVYSKDSNKNLFNLFPGTKKTVLNGNYKIPDGINNPTTEIQQTILKNMKNKNLEPHKILLKYKVLIAIVLFVLIGNFGVKKILSMIFHHDIAIDMGSAITSVYVKGKGVVIREPSLVAIEEKTGSIMAIGLMAKEMLGQSPTNIVVIRPIKNGVIADFDITEKMLSYFIRDIRIGPKSIKPRVVIGVPSYITQVERRAVKNAALRAGASKVFLIEKIMAAAIGAELPITGSGGNMIVDIGSGTTEVAVISLSGIVISKSIRTASNEMDKAIIQYIKRKYNLLIDERTAELIKIEIGSAYPLDRNMQIQIQGHDLSHGVPKNITVNDAEIREALEGVLHTIMEAVRDILEKTPPEISGSLLDRGIILSGGASLLRNLDKRLREETSLQVFITEDPLSSVILGLGKMVDNIDLLQKVGRQI